MNYELFWYEKNRIANLTIHNVVVALLMISATYGNILSCEVVMPYIPCCNIVQMCSDGGGYCALNT